MGRSLLFVAFALIAATLVPVEGQASTYFVSNDGNDAAAGTSTAAWRTLRHALPQLAAGDTLYLRGGTYTGADNTIDSTLGNVPSGTSWGNAVTIAGYPSETAIIQHPDGTAGIQLTGTVHSYIIIQDLVVDGINGTNTGISSIVYLSQGQHHIRVQRVEVKNGWVSGFNIYSSGTNSPFNEVLSCQIHGNGRSGVAGGSAIGGGGNYGYGLYIDASDTLVQGNAVYGNGGYGIQSVNDRNIIRDNVIHDNGTWGGTNYGIDIGAGIYPHTDGTLVYNNIIYGNHGGILVYTNSSNTKVYNNTIYKNAPLEGIGVEYIGGDVTLRNNIIYANAAPITDHGGAISGSIIQDHNLTSDPHFVSVDDRNFNLQAGSLAIDAGATVAEVTNDYAGVARPKGGQYDIGGYEYVADASQLAAPQHLRVAGTP